MLGQLKSVHPGIPDSEKSDPDPELPRDVSSPLWSYICIKGCPPIPKEINVLYTSPYHTISDSAAYCDLQVTFRSPELSDQNKTTKQCYDILEMHTYPTKS